jgi:hypothetical protein
MARASQAVGQRVLKGRVVKLMAGLNCRVSRPRWAMHAAALATLLLAGCGTGEELYQFSGAVTYKGKPVPTGQITFEPDVTKGNNGPSGYARIRDGRYDTSAEDGRGTKGGPHLVRILGQDGIVRGELLSGMPLFREYSTSKDLPRESGTVDFEVPAQ